MAAFRSVTSRDLLVTYKTGFWIGWLDLLTSYTHNSGLLQYSAITDLHTLQFTVTHALGFSVFTNRILATDL
jgi:hypothetical protein